MATRVRSLVAFLCDFFGLTRMTKSVRYKQQDKIGDFLTQRKTLNSDPIAIPP
jgi:hypothetical protein